MPSPSLPARALEHAGRVWPLAVVPLVASLLDVGRLLTLLGNTDRVFSVTFGVPRPVTTLWSFVNAQPNGVAVEPSALGGVAPFLSAVVVTAVVAGLLAAGYLGSIDAALGGGYDFLAAVRRYWRPLVGFSLLEAGVGLLLFGTALVAPPLLFVAAAVLFALAYLFFTAPYLVVVAGMDLVAALRRAATLATTDRRVLGFFLAYLGVSAVLSVPVSWVSFNAPPAGVAVGVGVAAPLALLLNVATLLFVRDLVGQSGPSNSPVDM